MVSSVYATDQVEIPACFWADTSNWAALALARHTLIRHHFWLGPCDRPRRPLSTSLLHRRREGAGQLSHILPRRADFPRYISPLMHVSPSTTMIQSIFGSFCCPFTTHAFTLKGRRSHCALAHALLAGCPNRSCDLWATRRHITHPDAKRSADYLVKVEWCATRASNTHPRTSTVLILTRMGLILELAQGGSTITTTQGLRFNVETLLEHSF